MRDEPRKLIQFTRADAIALKPTSWLIDGWLVRNTLAGLVGPSGSCKSFLALDWACRVATGTPWYARDVEQGAVFYLAGEGQSGIRKRIAGWEQATGTPIAGAPIFVADSLPALCEELNVAAVIEEVSNVAEEVFFQSGCDPSLIVVDTLARAIAGGDENSASDMGRIVRGLDWIRETWGCCVLTVHHTGNSEGAQDRARGSSAYRAALDSEFLCKATIDTVTVRGSKAKDWNTPAPLDLAKHTVPVNMPGIDHETTLVLRDAVGAAREIDQHERVHDLHGRGMTVRQIAEITQISKTTVGRIVGPTGSKAVPKRGTSRYASD